MGRLRGWLAGGGRCGRGRSVGCGVVMAVMLRSSEPRSGDVCLWWCRVGWCLLAVIPGSGDVGLSLWLVGCDGAVTRWLWRCDDRLESRLVDDYATEGYPDSVIDYATEGYPDS